MFAHIYLVCVCSMCVSAMCVCTFIHISRCAYVCRHICIKSNVCVFALCVCASALRVSALCVCVCAYTHIPCYMCVSAMRVCKHPPVCVVKDTRIAYRCVPTNTPCVYLLHVILHVCIYYMCLSSRYTRSIHMCTCG